MQMSRRHTLDSLNIRIVERFTCHFIELVRSMCVCVCVVVCVSVWESEWVYLHGFRRYLLFVIGDRTPKHTAPRITMQP